MVTDLRAASPRHKTANFFLLGDDLVEVLVEQANCLHSTSLHDEKRRNNETLFTSFAMNAKSTKRQQEAELRRN